MPAIARGGIVEHRAADPIQPGKIDDRIEHQDVFVADVVPHLARGQRADHQLGHSQRQCPHGGGADSSACRTAERDNARDLALRVMLGDQLGRAVAQPP